MKKRQPTLCTWCGDPLRTRQSKLVTDAAGRRHWFHSRCLKLHLTYLRKES